MSNVTLVQYMNQAENSEVTLSPVVGYTFFLNISERSFVFTEKNESHYATSRWLKLFINDIPLELKNTLHMREKIDRFGKLPNEFI